MTDLTIDGIYIDEGFDEGFHLAALTGWRDGAPNRVELESRPQAHGSFGPARTWRDSKVFSVEGSWSGGSLEAAYAALERMAALGSSGLPFEVKINEPFFSRTVSAYLTNGPELPDQIYQPYFTYAFDLAMADPFKYGPSSMASTGLPVPGGGLAWPLRWPLSWGVPPVSGRVSIRNVGTAETFPLLHVSGGGLSLGVLLSVRGSGQRLRLEYPVLDGQTVEFNGRTRRVLVDGVDRTGFLTEYEWWGVPAGGTVTVQFKALGVVTGSPRLTSLTQPAYF